MISFFIYQYIIYGWTLIGVITFFVLLFVTAPYGRHTTDKWGIQIDNRLGWILMELPVMLVLLYFVLPAASIQTTASWIMIGLFLLHYLNRVFIFPFRIRTKNKKMPLLIVGSAIFFNLINGFSLGYYFAHFATYSDSWLTDSRFVFGVILFCTGMFINLKSDEILIHLRKPGESNYVIPQGWLFKYISCPNLFGEIIEWTGFAILCWNLPATSFLIWTAANLIPRALSHHRWYKRNFENYPMERKALVPFVI